MASAASDSQREAEYEYHFTDKDVSDLKRLNWYELQHALYAAFKEYDKGDAEKGKRMIQDIYDEYARRGVTKVVPRFSS